MGVHVELREALGRTARAASGVRTRQPLPTLRVKLPAAADGLREELTAEVLDELNVKALELIPDESEMVERTLYPLLPVIGPRRGAAVVAVMAAARSSDWRLLDDGRVEVGGVTLEADEFELQARARPGHEVAEEGDLLVAVDTAVDEELAAEGLAREVAHRLQGLRKEAGYEISDRIRAAVGGDARLIDRLAGHRDWLADEVLAVELALGGDGLVGPDRAADLPAEGGVLRLAVRRA